ncbi:hypothetical protein BLNAU_17632 [Blattamonas nauphoetae]|uniref:Uncharacterized protein n=1 Tax=Blattamonas nauphoetae TaxID=2049346 RepID=A0ABQ9X9R8_9EUKA|nr:hypothetical protein BLNAU_17632 [Blattamonas nauphoetae]
MLVEVSSENDNAENDSSWKEPSHLSTLHSPHLIDEDGNMLEIGANEKIGLKDGSFSLQAEATTMLRTHPSAIRLDGCTFAIDSTSATEGSGPAAIEHCVSDEGSQVLFSSSTSSLASLSLNLACLSNCGADTSSKCVLIEGLDEQECGDVLKEGQHVGEGPHFGWSTGCDVGVRSIEFSVTTFRMSTLTRFPTPIENEPHCFHPSAIQLRDIVVDLSSGHMAIHALSRCLCRHSTDPGASAAHRRTGRLG